MMRTPPSGGVLLLSFLALLLSGCTAPAGDTASPYVDQLSSPVRGLSADEVEELRTGAGMGLARPAELNGYPGPLHVLELADALALTPAQRADVQATRDAVLAAAVPTGEAIIGAYGALDEAFRSGAIDAESLRMRLERIEGLYADLRFVHLEAHLRTFDVLSEHQRVTYEELRGYREPGAHNHAHGH